MVPSITHVLDQFKRSWTRQLEPAAIQRACEEAGHVWKERTLGAVTTVQLFLLQILHGNTAMTHLPRLARMSFTAGAYCQARARVSLRVFQILLRCVTDALQKTMLDDGRWMGHRVFFVDGSGFSMPDTKTLQDHFGQPGGQQAGCGFPVAHFLCLVHASTGMITKVLTSPLRTHDMSQVARLHPEMRADDVLVADRGFCSFAHLALVLQANLNAVFRVHQRQRIDFTPGRAYNMPGVTGKKYKRGLPNSRWIRTLGNHDQIVEWFKPKQPPRWMSAEQFASLASSIIVRELCYQIARDGFRCREITLVTTFNDVHKYTLEDLSQLYHDRWQIETSFGHLKTTMRMDVLRSQTVDGVLKELIVFCLIYNLVRQVMLEASRLQGVPLRRISFIDALRWLATAAVNDRLGPLIVTPNRPNRLEPRVRKRRPKQYPVMKQPRSVLRKSLINKDVTS